MNQQRLLVARLLQSAEALVGVCAGIAPEVYDDANLFRAFMVHLLDEMVDMTTIISLDWLSDYANKALPPPDPPGPPQSVRGWLRRVAAAGMAYSQGAHLAGGYEMLQEVLRQANEFIEGLISDALGEA